MSSMSSTNSNPSSNVSNNNGNSFINSSAPISLLQFPDLDSNSDSKYLERRRRNTEAARRSRLKRRQNDVNLEYQILELSNRNRQLEEELLQIKNDTTRNRAKKSKLANVPTTIEDNKASIQSPLPQPSPQINGLIFPILTHIKSEDIFTTSKTVQLLNDIDNPALFNIPFLSNLFEDITQKPTLFQSPFQSTASILDPTKPSGDTSLTAVFDPAENGKCNPQGQHDNSNLKIISECRDNSDLGKERTKRTIRSQMRRSFSNNRGLSIRNRLHIRKEMACVVNGKLHKLHAAVSNLTDEMKELKSTLMALVTLCHK